MKRKILSLLAFAAIVVAACNKQEVKVQRHLEDVVLENKSRDEEIATKRGGNKPDRPPGKPTKPTEPVDTTDPQPPPTDPPTTGNTVIYLDFDGETVTGTIWNAGTIICNPSQLTATGREQVRSNVAASYAQVSASIVVTTNKADFDATPINKRVHVIICDNNWYNPNAGGVAYINSYTWSDDTPCFVFSGSYGNDINNVSYAATHEPGHTFGCRHQSLYDAACVKVSEYRSGCIMGWGNAWAIGTSSLGCTVIQNDIEVIKSNL